MKIRRILLCLLLMWITTITWGQTKEICWTLGVPDGWAIVDARMCQNCCGVSASNEYAFRWTIKKIIDKPIGTQLWVCPSNWKLTKYDMPEGWSVIDVKECNKCCGDDFDSYYTKKWLIERLN